MRRATIAITVVLLAGIGLSACTKQEIRTVPTVNTAGVAPSLLVEQFLRASNAKDLDAMARIFGTKEGPVAGRDDRGQVEQRMFAIASILRHDDFSVINEERVPGRMDEATRLMVSLKVEEKKYNVPFTLVRAKNNTWLIEQIGIEVITSARSN